MLRPFFGRPRCSAVSAVIFAAGLALQGCVAAAVGTGTAAGVTAAEDRSIGDAVSDSAIHLKISQKFLASEADLYSRVNTEVVEGRVLLTGVVVLPADKVEASRLAWQVEGVKEVANEIQVTDRSGILNTVQDTWITTQLRTKIGLDREIYDINYSVETINGVVYLTGIARSRDELERVADHARTIRGVTRVVSHVRVGEARRG